MKNNLIVLLFIVLAHQGFAQSTEMKASIASITKNLSESSVKIKNFEWIETTTVYYNGEVKTKTTKQCYYGVDGKLNKVAVGSPVKEGKSPGGIRGKVASGKKQNIEEYIEKCFEKIEAYLPPYPGKLQAIVASGKAVISPLVPGKIYKIEFPDYLQEGDKVSITLDNSEGLLKEIGVATFIEGASDKVGFVIKYNSLPDMTSYPNEITLDAPSKKVKVIITNTGHKNAAAK